MKFLKQSLDTITLKELEKKLKKKGFMKKKDQYKERDTACMCAGIPSSISFIDGTRRDAMPDPIF